MFSFFRKKKKDADAPSLPAQQLEETPQEEALLETPSEENHSLSITEQAPPVEQESIKNTHEPLLTEKIDAAHENATTNEPVEQRIDQTSTSSETDAPATVAPAPSTEQRQGWLKRLSSGLKRTGQNITDVFTGGTQIDDALYEDLEAALLMADAGTAATQHLLEDVKRRVKETRATDSSAVRELLAQSLEQLIKPLEASLVIGEHIPTVIMVAGVNGAGKTTSIGKLTRHLANANHKVLLAAGDTFRAAAREQLEVWADRNQVEIVAQEGGDSASVSFDAVSSGKAKKVDVVIIDTAGRLATQPHLMEELKKIHRVIGKAMPEAPHEVLLVVDGNTGQNALAQVKAFDEAIGLTGLIVTKLDGTAKGGVIAAIALWSQEHEKADKPAVPIYFIGVGEQVEDLQTFHAKEFAGALLQA